VVRAAAQRPRQKTYNYSATFAVGLCQGPIMGIKRIWIGPDLFYNAESDDFATVVASNQAATEFAILLWHRGSTARPTYSG
jgi:hypothetical protein